MFYFMRQFYNKNVSQRYDKIPIHKIYLQHIFKNVHFDYE